jgi:hypothetical protein
MINPDLNTPTNVDANGLPVTASITPAQPTDINPSIKQSGAPVPFSPKAQNNISGVFGNPIANSYNRSMGTGGNNPPIPTIAPIVPIDNLYNS